MPGRPPLESGGLLPRRCAGERLPGLRRKNTGAQYKMVTLTADRKDEVTDVPGNAVRQMSGAAHPSIGIGFRVGKLTVQAPTEQRKNGYTVWECRCDCGGSIRLDTRALQRGAIRDCGCGRIKPGMKDLTGQRFGKLVCLEPTEKRGNSGGTVWRCRCDCGNICLAVSTQLTKGYKKSCGCQSHPPLKDLVGKRFGQLTVLSYAGKQAGMHRWKCLCDCGRETIVGQTLLQTGKTKSCGCLQAASIIDNLKLCDGTSVTMLEASKRHAISSNTSGYTGVYRSARSGKWQAQITFKRKTYYLGSFDKLEDAVKARKRGEEMHDDFLEWYYTEHKNSPSVSN